MRCSNVSRTLLNRTNRTQSTRTDGWEFDGDDDVCGTGRISCEQNPSSTLGVCVYISIGFTIIAHTHAIYCMNRNIIRTNIQRRQNVRTWNI